MHTLKATEPLQKIRCPKEFVGAGWKRIQASAELESGGWANLLKIVPCRALIDHVREHESLAGRKQREDTMDQEIIEKGCAGYKRERHKQNGDLPQRGSQRGSKTKCKKRTRNAKAMAWGKCEICAEIAMQVSNTK